MDNELYIWKHNIHDLLCRSLTDYESGEFQNINWEKEFYDLLVEVANTWDMITTEV